MRSIISVILLSLLVGCSVFRAVKSPEKKPIGLFSPGTQREMLIAEFGNPRTSETVNSSKTEPFMFRQGYSTFNRTGRATLYLAADVVTLCYWECFGGPIEDRLNGELMGYIVTYHTNDTVQTVVPWKNQSTSFYTNYTTLVISDPPGAIIEVDNCYIGESPVVITWEQTKQKSFSKSHVVTATPIHPGQFVQHKSFYGTYWPPCGGDIIPDKIYFRMTLVPYISENNINVNIIK